MNIGERLVGNVVVLDIKGEMTRYTGESSVRKRVGELLDRGHLSLLLNLSHVPYMDSSAVGEIVGSFISVRNRHGTLKIATSQSRVTKLLTIAKLDTVIDVFDTEAEALSSFGV
jgi:anti-sigma B factor antagonist